MFLIALKVCHIGSYSPVTHVANVIGWLNTGNSMNAICVWGHVYSFDYMDWFKYGMWQSPGLTTGKLFIFIVFLNLFLFLCLLTYRSRLCGDFLPLCDLYRALCSGTLPLVSQSMRNVWTHLAGRLIAALWLHQRYNALFKHQWW